MFRKKKTYVILILIVSIIGGIYYWKSRPEEISYTTEKAVKGKLIKTVSVTGKVVPPIQMDLSFKLSGQIESILVNVGDHVEAGQKIATVDTGTLENQLSAAEHELEVQKKTLSNMKERNDTYNKYQRDAQRAVIKKAEDAISQIKTEIEEATLFSPISGTIIRRSVEVGESVAAITTAVVTIATDGELKAEMDVPESDIVDVALGQKASVMLDAFSSNETLEAQVSEIEPASTVIQDVVYYKVKLKFVDPDSRLKVGMSADADINTAEKDNVVMIPLRAVKNDGREDYVDVLKPDNTTERATIIIGLRGDDGMVEVVSGLTGEEDVVVLLN